jgi:hypothetical protein
VSSGALPFRPRFLSQRTFNGPISPEGVRSVRQQCALAFYRVGKVLDHGNVYVLVHRKMLAAARDKSD